MSSRPPKAADPYSEVSLHGLWPLVVDDAAPGGVRFALLGRDGPETCVTKPEDLPNAEFSLRTFVGTSSRDAWIAAAREFGGNAVVAIAAPSNHNGDLQAVLLVRLDRDRTPADVLEEAVPVNRDLERYRTRSDLPALDAAGGNWRSRQLESLAEDTRRSGFASEWAGELAAIETSRRIRDNSRHDTDAHLKFAIDFPFSTDGEIRKRDGGVTVSLKTRGMEKLVGDHSEAWRIAVEARGWDATAADAIALDLAQLRPEDVARVEGDFDILKPTIARLTRLAASWTEVVAATTDIELMKMLRRIAAGIPVASGLYRDPGAQLSPRTGAPVPVAGARIDRAFRGGLIEPVWWRERYSNEKRDIPVPTPDSMHGILWGLTETGRAAVEGRIDDAAETQAEATARAQNWLRGRKLNDSPLPKPFVGPEVIAEAFVIEDERTRKAIETQRTRLRDGCDMPMWPEDLARTGGLIAAGLASTDGMKLHRRLEPGPSPRPGSST